jgi:two-component system NtrC family response regulator
MRRVPERLILVVDDEEPQRRVLAGFLRKAGYEVETRASAEEALEVVAARTVDLVLTDLRMPGGSGVELLDAVRGVNPEVPVVVMTAYGTVASAVDAMKRGAADYLAKPVDLDELEVLVARTLERRALVSENRALREQVESRYRLAGLETGNGRMQEAINMAARAAASRATILVHGESGTGKELLARAIHYASPRRRGPLVAVNVAALPETLLESELFGHERGAFTGADREHRGRFELADGGTLFLDEIGDLPRGTQVKLLRVLQEQAFERLGGTRAIKVDVRLVAATHRDLPAMVKSGDFREDLYFRLNVVAITLPPLRERREDVPLLVDHFLRRFADEGRARAVSREAMDLLLKHDYPGNVRELENLVHRAVVLARGATITTADLPLHLAGLKPEARGGEARGFAERVRAFEKALILEALEKAGGVQTRAAAALGMSERHLRYKLKKYGLQQPG